MRNAGFERGHMHANLRILHGFWTYFYAFWTVPERILNPRIRAALCDPTHHETAVMSGAQFPLPDERDVGTYNYGGTTVQFRYRRSRCIAKLHRSLTRALHTLLHRLMEARARSWISPSL